MTTLTASQRQALEDIASGKTKGWQEAPDVFGDHQMLYEAGLIAGANSSADDGFGLLDMRLTMAGQQALAVKTIRATAVRVPHSLEVFSPVQVSLPTEEVYVPVVRPFWKRWVFWSQLAVGVAGCITFAITVWPVVKELLKIT